MTKARGRMDLNHSIAAVQPDHEREPMLEAMIGRVVVVDLRSPYVCLGTLNRIDEQHVELLDADLHDLRDTVTSRENYVAASQATGIKRNRKSVLLVRAEVVAYTLLDDLVDE